MKKRIFIVGVGRSGTSLLQAILGSHSEVAFLPETSYLRRYVFDIPRVPSDEFWNAVKSDERVARLKPQWNDIEMDESLPLPLGVYQQLTATNKKITGDKDPRLVEAIECILSLWQDCQVIHLFRDPRDVLASKKKAAWSRNRSLLFHLVAGSAQYRLARLHRPGERIMHVQYETLISSPESLLENLCSWLGVAFEKEMLNFGGTAKRLTSEKEVSWKKETFGPLLSSNRGKWKKLLTAFEIHAVEVASSQVMTDGRYDPARARLSLVLRASAIVLGLTARLIAAIYVVKIRWKNRVVIKRLQKP